VSNNKYVSLFIGIGILSSRIAHLWGTIDRYQQSSWVVEATQLCESCHYDVMSNPHLVFDI